jgi:hypothetical protein
VLDSIDYSKYSLDDLYSAYESIDRDRYPERTQELISRIGELEKEPLVKKSLNTESYSSFKKQRIKSMLDDGTTKSDVFKILKDENFNPIKVSKYLAYIPDKEAINNYKNHHLGLVISLAVFYLIFILTFAISTGLSSSVQEFLFYFAIGAAIPSIIIFSIYKAKAGGFLILCFFLSKGIIESLPSLSDAPVESSIGIGLNIFFIVYSIFLKNKFYPNQNFFNTKKSGDGTYVY